MTLRTQQMTTSPSTHSAGVQVRPGAYWGSFEQLRVAGPTAITEAVQAGSIGRLRIRDHEYVVMTWSDFDRLYGAARDVERLSQGVLLLRQAANVVMTS